MGLFLAALIGLSPSFALEPPVETPEAAQVRHALVKERRERVHILCHRGAAEFAHENTLEAYRAALELGADGNEIDIRITKDGVLVCFHDDMLDQILSAFGDMSDYDWDELQTFTFREPGKHGEQCRIPTLAEVFALHRERGGLMHLDIKRPGLDRAIATLLDGWNMWDHVAYCNMDNGGALLTNPKLKLLKYKGSLYANRAEVFPAAIKSMLAKPGDGVIVDDPRGVLVALERKIGKVSTEPVSPQRRLPKKVTPPTQEEMLAFLKETTAPVPTPKTDDEQRAAAEQILARAKFAERILQAKIVTPTSYGVLEVIRKNRSLHPQWEYHGLDAATALRAEILLRSKGAIGAAREALWSDDPALETVANPKYKNPRSWTDFRLKNVALQSLAHVQCASCQKVFRDYLALSEEEAAKLGPPQFEAAAAALLMSEREDVVLELLQHPLQVVRGRAILHCLAHADHPWAIPALKKHAPHAIAYMAPK